MNPRAEMISYLTANSITNVYTPPVSPSVALPYVCITLISCPADNDNLLETVFREQNWQIDVYGETTAQVDVLASSVETAFNKAGQFPVYGGAAVSSMRIMDFSDNTELEHEGAEESIIRYTYEVKILK